MSCPIQDEIRSRRGKELNELLDLDYSVKKRLARMIIHNALQKHKDAFVSCSFGRDSIVLLHLVKTLTDRVKVIHCNTGIEFRENLDLMHYLTEEWNLLKALGILEKIGLIKSTKMRFWDEGRRRKTDLFRFWYVDDKDFREIILRQTLDYYL